MTNHKMSNIVVNAGIDIDKSLFGICIHEKSFHWQDDNTEEDIKRILKRLAHYQIDRLLMEATGGYEFNIAQAVYSKDR